jgi:hypothetical protein
MRWRVLSVAFFATVLAVHLVPAQKLGRSGTAKYDLPNEAKIKALVEEVKELSKCAVTDGTDAHLMVKTSDKESKIVLVHLAPSRFLKEYGVSFAKGDQIEILGSKTKIADEEQSILARKIERGNQTYTFRDDGGKPLW